MNTDSQPFTLSLTDKISRTLFVILCAALLITLTQMFAQKRLPAIETDLLALFDYNKSNPVLDKAIKNLQKNAQNKIIVGFGSSKKDKAQQISVQALDLLKDSASITLHNLNDTLSARESLIETLKQHRRFLLTPQDQQTLSTQTLTALKQQTLQSLYGIGQSGLLRFAQDPLALFQNFVISGLPSSGNTSIEDDFLIIQTPEGQHYYFLSATINGNPLDLAVQEAFFNDFNQILETIEAASPQDLDVIYSGVVFHAGTAAQQAKNELALISIVSILSIVSLFLLCFRSLVHLLLGLMSIGFGCFSALLLSQLLFDSIHLITLVFGASLIGVSIDYALHYFAFHNRPNASQQKHQHLYPALVFSLVSTLAAYACLFNAPLPGLQQMAFFAIFGLISAWLFVLCLFPRLLRKTVYLHPKSFQYASVFLSFWQRFSVNNVLTFCFALALCSTFIILSSLNFNAEAKAMYKPPADLLYNDKKINRLLSNVSGSQFIFVHANNLEEALQKEEMILPQLRTVSTQDIIALSQLLPSQKQQQLNDIQLNSLYATNKGYHAILQELGMTAQAIDNLKRDYSQSTLHPLQLSHLKIDTLEEYRLTLMQSEFGESIDGTLILLLGDSDKNAIQQLLEHHPDIEYVDQIQSLGHFLKGQIHSTLKLLAFAYLAVCCLVYLLYRQIRALFLVAVPMLSSLLTLSALTLMNIDVSLFHLFGLFLILGLGMDYSIFLSHYTREHTDTLVAIFLSAITSCLSFGLLAYSSTLMIAHFGLTVLLGSIFNLVLVPLVTFLRMQAGQSSV